MNYYPNNFYGNYPYGNSYPQMSNIAPGAALSSLNQNFLNGKVVDGEEVVKATEVPFGGYGVFPKADLNEIYIKTWTPEGKTKIIKFQPVEEGSEQKEDTMTVLLDKVTAIEEQLGGLLNLKTNEKSAPATAEKRKELNMNAY